jgi:flagellar biogenesis protein FliO
MRGRLKDALKERATLTVGRGEWAGVSAQADNYAVVGKMGVVLLLLLLLLLLVRVDEKNSGVD